MNYIWQVLLQKMDNNEEISSLKFKPADNYCAYLEVVTDYFNVQQWQGEVIEINPYHRFNHLFGDYITPKDIPEVLDIKTEYFNHCMHLLSHNDLYKGVDQETYHRQFIEEQIHEGIWGNKVKEYFIYFSSQEKRILLKGIQTLYKIGTTITLLVQIIKQVFKGSCIYKSQERGNEIYIYIPERKTPVLEKKLELIRWFFMDIEVQSHIYWDRHFGIIGIESTMKIDEIVVDGGV